MRKLNFLTLGIFIVSVESAGLAHAQDEVQNIPKLSLFMYLEHETIRENDPMHIVIWILNESSQNLTDIKLYVAAPVFLHWYQDESSLIDSCNGPEIRFPLRVDSMSAHSTLNYKFCAKFTSGRVGTFKLLSTVQYRWITDKRQGQSYATSEEKSFSIDIFGTDEVLGIPLAFAGFVVPGLFLWFTLHTFRVPFSLNLPSDEKLIFSVVTSVCLMGLPLLIRSFFDWELKYLDMSSEISAIKLVALAVIGIVFGLLVGGGYRLLLWLKMRAEREKLISPNDDYVRFLIAILKLNPNYIGVPIRIKDSEGNQYVGSHFAETTGSIDVYLVGSFQIKAQELKAIIDIGNFLDQKNNLKQDRTVLLKILKAVDSHNNRKGKQDNKIEIKLRHSIEAVTSNATLKAGEDAYLVWKKEEISKPVSDRRRKHPLLEIVETKMADPKAGHFRN